LPRVRHQVAARKRRKKILKKAKGYYGGRRKLYRTAKETVQRAMAYSYRDRRNKKRAFRSLWIIRINAACRLLGLSYSGFMDGLKKMGVAIDRKNLAEIAVKDPQTFAQLAQMVKQG
jgi:large subunit ribosomal protein L20